MRHEFAVTGLGVVTATAPNPAAFAAALLRGERAFDVMKRVGRQRNSAYLGAEIPEAFVSTQVHGQPLRNASLSARVALVVLEQAWAEARLADVDPSRVGLIVGGSNLQQRELRLAQDAYSDKPQFLRPTYGMSFLDTDLCGLCAERFGIRGAAYTVGGASASGQLAIIQAMHTLQAEQVDVCIALGALMDLSYWECQGLRALGAMGSDRFAAVPASACRPFDRDRDGFIFGEACGAVVIERADAVRAGTTPYALLSGWGMSSDGNRNPNPSREGEVSAIREALRRGGCAPGDLDYINPHGSGSIVGDDTELAALEECGLTSAFLNSTKSLVGHALTAAGAVEVVATLLQMRSGTLHPSMNLDFPLSSSFNWVRSSPVEHRIENALTLSVGFGGINTALMLRRYQ